MIFYGYCFYSLKTGGATLVGGLKIGFGLPYAKLNKSKINIDNQIINIVR